MIRRKPLARSGRVNPVNPTRRKSEWSRVYHSKARVAWMQAQPCVVCGVTPSENAHVIGGGAGRKADATCIIPLCKTHHALQHQKGWGALAPVGKGLDSLDVRLALAKAVHQRWERYAEGG